MKLIHRKTIAALALAAMTAIPAFAQPGPEDGSRPQPARREGGRQMPPQMPGAPGAPGGPDGMRGPQGPGEGGFRGMRPGGPGHPGGFSVDALLSPKLTEDLQISDEQTEKLKKIRVANEKKSIDQDAELRKAEVDLREAMNTDGELDRGEIMAKIDAVGKLRTERQKQEVSEMLEARAVLSADQVKKLKELRKARRVAMRERRGPDGPEGDADGPDRPRPARADRDERGERGDRGDRPEPKDAPEPPAPDQQ